jgi:large subunit ribosomal protein L1
MTKRGKRYRGAREAVVADEVFSPEIALSKVKELAKAKFDESIDVDVKVGIDPSKGDQVVRGSVVLPHGQGKRTSVVVFAKGVYAEKAQSAGADYVGAEDLIEKISGGWLDFDYAVATPDLMGIVSKVARLMGPRGLLPNKKLGTVTFDVDRIVKDLKSGRVFFKNDKGGVIHFSLGKASFSVEQLHENLIAFIKSLAAAKPSASKGKFIRKATVSSTMGIGVGVSPDEIVRA